MLIFHPKVGASLCVGVFPTKKFSADSEYVRPRAFEIIDEGVDERSVLMAITLEFKTEH